MDTLQKLFKKTFTGGLRPLVNKYTAVLIIFAIWIGFVDRYSFVNQVKLSKNLQKLESAKADYEKQLEEALEERKEFEKNKEKFAREKYLFHKENEQVILVK